MTGDIITTPQGDALRRRAEDVFREKAAGMAEDVESLSPEEVRQLVHELQVHQIELEMQNEELRRTQEELEASRARYFDLYDLAPVGYFTLSEAGLILEANLTAAVLLGVPRSALVKLPLTRFILPTDQDIYYGHRQLLFETGAPQVCEFRMLRVAAAPFWARIEATAAQDDDGAPVCRTVMIDVTDRKQAEEEIRRLNAELERRVIERTDQLNTANKEMAAFTYSLSHDLRAPLRAVDGYAQILLEDFGPRLDDEGRRICSVISENGRTMGKLIDYLLAFSRIGRADMQRSPVDMAPLAQSVFLELTTSSEQERIDFHVGPLPRAIGDPSLLRQVWMNLIGNAVKFSAKKERAVIKVGCVSEIIKGKPAVVYFVRDNGAGFDMAYADKLFGVFQRLHGTKEFEGTGVGLAITQRIVQRHDGRIRAEGEVGKGATFYFNLDEEM